MVSAFGILPEVLLELYPKCGSHNSDFGRLIKLKA